MHRIINHRNITVNHSSSAKNAFQIFFKNTFGWSRKSNKNFVLSWVQEQKDLDKSSHVLLDIYKCCTWKSGRQNLLRNQ